MWWAFIANTSLQECEHNLFIINFNYCNFFFNTVFRCMLLQLLHSFNFFVTSTSTKSSTFVLLSTSMLPSIFALLMHNIQLLHYFQLMCCLQLLCCFQIICYLQLLRCLCTIFNFYDVFNFCTDFNLCGFNIFKLYSYNTSCVFFIGFNIAFLLTSSLYFVLIH